MDLSSLNTSEYYKALQKMYCEIKEIDSQAVIVQYHKQITTTNESGVGVQVKYVILNYTKATPH